MKNLPIVLVVEDDKAIVHLLSTILDANDYRVVQVSTGREALSTISSHCPDVVLLDLGLPDMDGVDIIKNVRQWSQVPIIVLSARNRERDKVEALDLGADDYLAKPFGMMELVARVRAVLRRTQDAVSPAEHVLLSDGPISLDERAHTVCVSGQPVQLTLKEYQLLTLLMKNQGAVLTRDVLLENIWGYGSESETRTVDVHIRTLRQKLGDGGALIETVRGVGYRMGGNA